MQEMVKIYTSWFTFGLLLKGNIYNALEIHQMLMFLYS